MPKLSLTARRAATSWKEVGPCVEARPAKTETVSYGLSRSMCGKEVMVDFGNPSDGASGDLSMVTLTFRTEEQASAAYCRGIKLTLKTTEHPEHDL